jgi:DNA-directed RNA polymerase I subunit RPA2
MAPITTSTGTNTEWSTEFDTVRRHKLFSNPPKDHTAYPLLAAAIRPHVDSVNAVFEPNGLLEQAIKDIGTKVFLDGNPNAPPEERVDRNRLSLKIRDVILQKPQLPPSNKFNVKRREILPSECRERHASYRGKLTVRLAYKVNNGDWKEMVRELGNVPIMVRVCQSKRMNSY